MSATPTMSGPVHRVLIRVLLTTWLILGVGVTGAPAAVAGGPTSVLATNYASGLAGAAITGSAAYEDLVDALEVSAVGSNQVATAQTEPPAGVDLGTADIRLTWFIHDVTAWRLDEIHEVGADIWVSTAEQFGDGSVHDVTPVWRKVANAKKLRATLISMGAMVGDADARSSTTPSGVASAAPAALPTVAQPSPPTSRAQASEDDTGGSRAGLALAAGALLLGFVAGRIRRRPLAARQT